jgi:hypothetical protein
MDKKPASDKVNPEFAKARFDYCLQLYERERKRKESLEQKAQFYLSLVTLFMGALLFKPDLFNEIQDRLSAGSVPAPGVPLLYGAGGVLVFSLLFAMLCVLMSVQVRGYLSEHPARLMDSLFNKNSSYLAEQSPAAFHTATAANYAMATRSDSDKNDQKSMWVRWASYSVLAAVFAFAMLYVIVLVLRLS